MPRQQRLSRREQQLIRLDRVRTITLTLTLMEATAAVEEAKLHLELKRAAAEEARVNAADEAAAVEEAKLQLKHKRAATE